MREKLAKSVKVHDDTHKVLKQMKSRARSKSIDEVIREMIRASTGSSVERSAARGGSVELTTYMEPEKQK